jgi:hypothetical protein
MAVLRATEQLQFQVRKGDHRSAMTVIPSGVLGLSLLALVACDKLKKDDTSPTSSVTDGARMLQAVVPRRRALSEDLRADRLILGR